MLEWPARAARDARGAGHSARETAVWTLPAKDINGEPVEAPQVATRQYSDGPDAGEPAPRAPVGIARVERMGAVGVATFTVTQLTREHGVESLTELLETLTASGATHFVLDIQNINYMDSACLGCLVEALNRLAVSGGQIALVNTATSVQDLFRMTRLDRVFPICNDVPEAMKKLGQWPEDMEE